jgi:hypothetical protein
VRMIHVFPCVKTDDVILFLRLLIGFYQSIR